MESHPKQTDGFDRPASPSLAVESHGVQFPNPFIIGSGPPGTNVNVIGKAFQEGWGGVVAKTACLDHGRIQNVSPRYSRLKLGREIIGWQNIELISDRPFEQWLREYREVKSLYPDRVLIASIMEEHSKDAWIEIVERTQACGVDILELNLSCPHGLPERNMGSAMGQDPELVEEVCGWVMSVAKVPVWAKLTPNITDIASAGRAALRAGCHGLSAINTILSVINIDLETLRPEPTVEGYSTPGGYSGRAIRPISLRMNMELGKLKATEFPNASLSALGGVETSDDAAQFILAGATTVQVCTGVMIHGYHLIQELKAGLEAFMFRHGFSSLSEVRGRALPFFTSHAELVAKQHASRAAAKASSTSAPSRAASINGDNDWQPEIFVVQSGNLAAR